MVKVTIDGQEIEAPEGAPLVEVIKEAGIFVPHLCYVDGLEPYAGCRTCVVEIEGMRGLPLSCTTKVTEGMVVRTDTPEALEMRKAVVSIINANHSDRCLTCHRRVKCMPGDTCLRDQVVTHRCVTCSKNYRCELQTTNELVGMANYEPFLGEERTYYHAEPPEPDRANPFLEFDAQMCIICTRCVRTCDDIRHTGAITLAGRGETTRIAFGAGGPVHESNCDFCGSCIDACPTAALMEQPNKWIGHTDEWVPTACNSCSVGCTISLGVRNGKGVIARPDALNPVSFDQICVRGRFHYDAVGDKERLASPMLRSNGASELAGALRPASWEEALDTAAERLARIREEHGPGAIAFLGSPVATNEENYLVGKLARDVIGTNNVDFAAGPVARAVADALRAAFGTEALPADMTRIAEASTVIVIANDLESSHNVAALRAKDAVVKNDARLIVVSPRYGEVCDFASDPGGWLRPRPGGEAEAVLALAAAMSARPEVPEPAGVAGLEALKAVDGDAGGVDKETLEQAVTLLAEAAGQEGHVAIVFAPDPIGAFSAGETAKAAANLALVCCGAADAAASLHVLPSEANVNGARDMGIAPDLLPGLRPLDDATRGLGFGEMLSAIQEGRLRALVVAGDNPLLWAPNRSLVEECLERLELLLVIDSLPTDVAQRAHVLLPDVPTYAKDGTYTSADRRLLRLKAALSPRGEARPAWRSLVELGRRLAERLSAQGVSFDYESPSEILAEIASLVSAYRETVHYGTTPVGLGFLSGKTRVLPEEAPLQANVQALTTVEAPAGDGLVLTTGRSLYTSLEGASIHSPEADKLHREEFVEVHPTDAADLRVSPGDEVVLSDGRAELPIKVAISDAVQPGTLFVPLYYDGGAVTALIPSDDGVPLLPRVKVAVRTPA